MFLSMFFWVDYLKAKKMFILYFKRPFLLSAFDYHLFKALLPVLTFEYFN